MPARDAKVSWNERKGVWFARPYVGTNKVTGKPMRPYRSFPSAQSREEAQDLCDKWLASMAPAIGLGIGRTIPEIAFAYINHLESRGHAPSTIKAYRSLTNRYLVPVLGTVDIDEARPYVIEGAYAVIMARGGRYGEEISPRTVSQMHWLLSGMFKWAVRIGITDINPMPSVARPKWLQTEAVAFDVTEMAMLETALIKEMTIHGSSSEEIFRRNVATAAWIALRTGARCGEVLALSRKNSILRRGGASIRIDATVNEVPGKGAVVRPATKGKKGRNVAVTNEDMVGMRAHASWQQETYLANPQPNTPLCCLSGGEPIRPSSASRSFSKLRDQIGLPKNTSFHTLRHTHATWLLYNGVDIKTVSERLGHAKVSTTLELYAHVLPGRDEVAAEAFGDIMKEVDGARQASGNI